MWTDFLFGFSFQETLRAAAKMTAAGPIQSITITRCRKIAGEGGYMKPFNGFRAWKKVELGTENDANFLIAKIESPDSGIIMTGSEEWKLAIRDMTIAPPKTVVELVRVSGVELHYGTTKERILATYGGHVSWQDDCKTAESFGLIICSMETLFQLRIQYQHDGQGDDLWVPARLNDLIYMGYVGHSSGHSVYGPVTNSVGGWLTGMGPRADGTSDYVFQLPGHPESCS